MDKYPLLQALDAKKSGVRTHGYGGLTRGKRVPVIDGWLLALAADAVRYAQGEQLVATSEK